MTVPPLVSRDYYNKGKNRTSLVFQQGKSVLDSELNQIQQIQAGYLAEVVQHSVGNGYLGDSFLVYPSGNPNEVKVTKGTFYWDGRAVCIPEDYTVSGLSTPSSARTDYVFVEFEDMVRDTVDDPELFDVVLGRTTVFSTMRVVDIFVSEGVLPTPNPYRINQWFRIARLERPSGASLIIPAHIKDERIRSTNNYVTEGLRVRKEAGLTYNYDPGIATVGNFDFYVQNPGPSVLPNKASGLFELHAGKFILIEANPTGAIGNSITMEFVIPTAPPSANFPLLITKMGFNIKISLQTDTHMPPTAPFATFQEVVNFINAQASELVMASLLNVGDAGEWADLEVLRTALQGGVDGQPGVRIVPKSAECYVYVDRYGNVVNNIVRPTEYHVLLAKTVSDEDAITSVTDLRFHRPAAARGGLANQFYAPGGQIETDIQEPTAGTGSAEEVKLYEETAMKYQLLALGSTPNNVILASAKDHTKPCIGMASQDTAAGVKQQVLYEGEVEIPGANFVINGRVFLDLVEGAFTQRDYGEIPENIDLYGRGVPGPSVGVSYDLYQDTDTDYVYQKLGGVWVLQWRPGCVSQRLGKATTTSRFLFKPEQVYIINN